MLHLGHDLRHAEVVPSQAIGAANTDVVGRGCYTHPTTATVRIFANNWSNRPTKTEIGNEE